VTGSSSRAADERVILFSAPLALFVAAQRTWAVPPAWERSPSRGCSPIWARLPPLGDPFRERRTSIYGAGHPGVRVCAGARLRGRAAQHSVGGSPGTVLYAFFYFVPLSICLLGFSYSPSSQRSSRPRRRWRSKCRLSTGTSRTRSTSSPRPSSRHPDQADEDPGRNPYRRGGWLSQATDADATTLGRTAYRKWNIGHDWDNGVFFMMPATGRVHVIWTRSVPSSPPPSRAGDGRRQADAVDESQDRASRGPDA